MDQIIYVVQPEGDKFVLYKKYMYDSGHPKLVWVEDFKFEAVAQSECERLNSGGNIDGW